MMIDFQVIHDPYITTVRHMFIMHYVSRWVVTSNLVKIQPSRLETLFG
jgi:hypothetical protein